MLNFYRIKYECYHNNTLINTHSGIILSDKSPEDDVVLVNWDNLSEVYQRMGGCLPFHCYKCNKGHKVCFFDGSVFNKAYRDIKEWKSPLNISIVIKYAEIESMSIQEILRWHDGEKAIQYLIERGLAITGK